MDDLDRFDDFKQAVTQIHPNDLRFALEWMKEYIYQLECMKKQDYQHWPPEPTD